MSRIDCHIGNLKFQGPTDTLTHPLIAVLQTLEHWLVMCHHDRYVEFFIWCCCHLIFCGAQLSLAQLGTAFELFVVPAHHENKAVKMIDACVRSRNLRRSLFPTSLRFCTCQCMPTRPTQLFAAVLDLFFITPERAPILYSLAVLLAGMRICGMA